MADGFRISESGDTRISEADDLRITEQIFFASASLSNSSGYYRVDELDNSRVSEDGVARVSEDFDSVAVTFTGEITKYSAVSLQASSSLDNLADVYQKGSTSLTATGTSSFLAVAEVYTSSSLTSEGTTTLVGKRIRGVDSSLSSSSTIETSFNFIFGGLFRADPDFEYGRATEEGDVRVTEANDVRIVVNIAPNGAASSMVASVTYIVFSSTAYVKYEGEWKEFTPTVKQSGEWDDPIAIYKKIDSINWKRAY